jgi:hypothetical protein
MAHPSGELVNPNWPPAIEKAAAGVGVLVRRALMTGLLAGLHPQENFAAAFSVPDEIRAEVDERMRRAV